jgi:hypothetical protein
MNKNGSIPINTFCLLVILLFLACACTYQGDEYTFSAPLDLKTKQFDPPESNLNHDPELLLVSKDGHMYFELSRQYIPQEADLESVFNAHKTQTSEISSHYQFISQSTIQINDRSAIEYIYREFSGEPYWQRREIWLENNDWAYVLSCSEPVDSTPGLDIPVSEQCIHLVEDFRFK